MKTSKLLSITAMNILIVCVLMRTAFAYTWEKTFGEIYWDKGSSAQQTADGGYIIGGEKGRGLSTYSDIYLIKINPNKNEEWIKTFGGEFGDNDGGIVRQAVDGGYIIAGSTSAFGAGLFDVYLIKTSASGDEVWSKTFGGNDYDQAYSIQLTADNGYIIAGSTRSFGAGNYDVYLIKTDANGVEQWSKTFGGNDDDVGYSVQQTADGGYIIAGFSFSFGAGYGDVYLIKTDSVGDEMWSKTFGGASDDRGYSVQQTTDGGYIIVGSTGSFGAGGWDIYFIKTDAKGKEQWSKTLGTDLHNQGYSVQQTIDGGYIIVGETQIPVSFNDDVYLIKTDIYGNESWSETFGGAGGVDRGFSVQQTTAGGYIISGETSSFGSGSYDVYLINYKPVPGDLNDDGGVALSDAILSLQVLTGIKPTAAIHRGSDVNGDGKVGLEEVIYILQTVSEMR